MKETLPWIILSFVAGAFLGASLVYRFMVDLADGWQKLYYNLKDQCEDEEEGGGE